MPRVAKLCFAATLSLFGCDLDWNSFDPRLATSTTGGLAGAGGEPASSSSTGAGSPASSSGSGGAGGMSSSGGAGGLGGAGGSTPAAVCNGEVVPWLANGVSVTGNTVMAPTQLEAVCTGSTGGERVFAFMLGSTADVIVTTELPGTNYDVVQYVRGMCEDSTTELSCADPGPGDTHSLPGLPAGTYFVIVDSHSTTQEGDFELQVSW